jgi:hypothetical protein
MTAQPAPARIPRMIRSFSTVLPATALMLAAIFLGPHPPLS